VESREYLAAAQFEVRVPELQKAAQRPSEFALPVPPRRNHQIRGD